MKIVLRDDVEKLGRKGDIVEVAPGYARNYLVPKGLAIAATRGIVAQAEAMRRNRESKDRKDREAALALAGLFQGKAVTVTARSGEGGKLCGSVGASDVAAAIQEQFGVEIDRRKIGGADEAWKTLGSHEVSIRLHPDIVPTLTVNIVGRDA